MPRVCTICSHPEREVIDRLLVSGEASIRAIAGRHAVSRSALSRHRAQHVPQQLAKAVEQDELGAAIDLMGELRAALEQLKRLVAACDDALKDPDDPSRYTLDPRAEDVSVVFSTRGKSGKSKRRKERLSAILQRLDSNGFDVAYVETRRTDPAVLLNRTTARLEGLLHLVGKLLGELGEDALVEIYNHVPASNSPPDIPIYVLEDPRVVYALGQVREAIAVVEREHREQATGPDYEQTQ